MARDLHRIEPLTIMRGLMRSLLRSLAVAALLLTPVAAQADPLADLAAAVRQETATVERMEAAQASSRSRYERLSAAIVAAKRAQGLNPVASATLQSDLRLAHEQAVALQRSEGELMASRIRLDGLTEQYRESLLAQIETLQSARPQPGRAGAVRAEIERLSGALQQLRAPLPPMSRSPVAAILDLGAPTPEQLDASALELRDHIARLQRQLGEVRERLAGEEQQRRLQARLRAMAVSDALFEEGFGSRGRVSRPGAAVAERGTASSDAATGAASPEFSGLAADGAVPPSTGPVTGAPGGEGGRVPVGGGGRTESGPVVGQAASTSTVPRAVVELRTREAALVKQLSEATAAQSRLLQTAAAMRAAEQQAP